MSNHPLPNRPLRRSLAVAALALLCGWTLYTIPPARARAEAALRPWLPAQTDVRFGEVSARRGELNGQTVLYVEGWLVNASARRLKAPALRVALIGDDGRPVYTWKAKAARPEIEAGKDAPFQTRLLAPPERFLRIEITPAQEG